MRIAAEQGNLSLQRGLVSSRLRRMKSAHITKSRAGVSPPTPMKLRGARIIAAFPTELDGAGSRICDRSPYRTLGSGQFEHSYHVPTMFCSVLASDIDS